MVVVWKVGWLGDVVAGPTTALFGVASPIPSLLNHLHFDDQPHHHTK